MTPTDQYAQPSDPAVRTFTGTGLDELLPQIRAAFGEDAIILARRDGVEGGIGGFFGRRTVEVDARAAGARIDVRDDDPAFADQLAGFLAERAPDDAGAAALPPAPQHRPVVAPQVADDPRQPSAWTPKPAAAPTTPPPVFAEDVHFSQAGLGQMDAVPAPAPALEPVHFSEPRYGEMDAVPGPSGAGLDDADALVQASAPSPPPLAPEPVATPSALGRDGAALLATGLSAALTADLVHTAAAHVAPLAQDSSPRGVLRAALQARIPVATPVRGPGGAVIGFVGPGGSGKTRCVARLATAYAKRSALPVACITLRPADGGAELTHLLEAAGVPVHVETDAFAAARRIDALRNETIVLLDTPGVSPRAEAELRTLSSELRQLAADELHLAVPATIGPFAARELAQAGRELGVSGIALTHADETLALGTVVELAIDAGVPLSYVARGTALDGGMRPAAADALALALLGPIESDDDLV